MGNCSGRKRSNDVLKMETREQEKFQTDNLRRCRSDHPIYTAISSPVSDSGETISKSSRSNGQIPCRIPILKESPSVINGSLSHSKGSYKSVLNDRPTGSRIPITHTTVECRKSIPAWNQDGDIDNSQFNESGFASDLSVTASTHSQMYTESKSTDIAGHDRAEELSSRHTKLPSKPTNLSIRNRMQENVINIANACASTIGPFTPEDITMRSSIRSAKSVSTYNIENTLRRPQSMSTESEALINKSLSKRCSEECELLSPSVSMHEHSAVMQDVFSLKLMLHKLKRYLIQDGDDRFFDVTNDCVFRLASPLASNIKCLTREELEQKYDLLMEHNVSLERQLQSRERVIARMQAEKLPGAGRVVQTALGDHQDHGTSPGHQSALYWSNLKLPEAPL